MNAAQILLILAMPAIVGGTVNASGSPASERVSGDFVPFPAGKGEVVSPGGDYLLTIESLDEWRSKAAHARLARRTAAGDVMVWEQSLPQEYGPRYALVDDGGRVVFFDESINVASRFAIMVLDPAGKVRANHGFESVARLLGIATAAIVEQANGGSWWISAPPVFDMQSRQVLVNTAGQRIAVDLETGKISLAD